MLSSEVELLGLSEAIIQINLGRYERALELLQTALAENPENGSLLLLAASCYYGISQYDEAEKFCLEAMENGEVDTASYALLGRIYFQKNLFVESEKNFLESLRLNPNQASVLANYGYLMLATGHRQKAKRLIDEALRIDPEDETALHFAFYYYVVTNKKHDQTATLSKYWTVSDDEVPKLVKAGTVEMYNNNYKAARNYFREAFVLEPTDKDILKVLKELDREAHPLYLPQRIIRKLGGPIPVWIGFTVVLFGLRWLKFETAFLVWAVLYLVLCIATYITPSLYKHTEK